MNLQKHAGIHSKFYELSNWYLFRQWQGSHFAIKIRQSSLLSKLYFLTRKVTLCISTIQNLHSADFKMKINIPSLSLTVNLTYYWTHFTNVSIDYLPIQPPASKKQNQKIKMSLEILNFTLSIVIPLVTTILV